MSKISELSDGGSLQSTDYLIAVRSGGNVKVRPNGAVSGTTGQFSTSLNVDGTVTADGLTVDTNTLHVDATNNRVGIGTTSPEAPLDAEGAGALVANFNGTNANGGYVRFQNSSTSIGDIGAGAQVLSGGTAGDFGVTSRSGNLVFGTGTTERARIDSSGALLVGTTTSAGAGGVGLTGQFRAGYQGVLNGFGNEDFSGLFFSGGSSSGFVAINSNSGNIPLYLSLSSSASTGALINFADTGTTVGTISTNGTTTSYNTSSDARLKENIADAEDAGAKVDAIQVRQFDWKADGSHQDYGMIAQELLEVAPEAVSGDPESDDMMGVDYSKLVPMLVKEIQSLRARMAQLEGA